MKTKLFRALLVAFVFGVVASMSISAQNAGISGAKSDNTVAKEEVKQDLGEKEKEVEQKVKEEGGGGCCG